MKAHSREKIQRLIRRFHYLAAARSVKRPTFDAVNLERKGYRSQSGQDKWVSENLLKGLHGGVFVDIGANDGVTLSNTLWLERHLEWTGLAVEPNPVVFARLKANRSCTAINACVSGTTGRQVFQAVSGYGEMLSGLVDEYDPRHEDRILKEVHEKGGSVEQMEVDCYTLSDLLSTYGLESVDYLSIDVEGAELSILQSIDLRRFHIQVIGVENNYEDYRIPQLLTHNGYRFHSVVGDEFYVRNP
jgi:FkbM family methyltransferase